MTTIQGRPSRMYQRRPDAVIPNVFSPDAALTQSTSQAPPYRLGDILMLVDGDLRSLTFPLTRKYFRPGGTQPLFRDEFGHAYFSVHHYIQIQMILFFSGRLPESEPHFQSTETLRLAAEDNYRLFLNARETIASVHELRRTMGGLKLREFNSDFWFQSQSLTEAMHVANYLKFTQNEDLRRLLLQSSGPATLFMEVSGPDQCFFGAGYTLEFLEKNNHFYSHRPQLWRGWNHFGDSVRLTRSLLAMTPPPPSPPPLQHSRQASSPPRKQVKRDHH